MLSGSRASTVKVIKLMIEDIYHRLARPVEFTVIDVAFTLEEILEDFPQIVVVGCLEEVQSPHVAQVGGELLRMVLT